MEAKGRKMPEFVAIQGLDQGPEGWTILAPFQEQFQERVTGRDRHLLQSAQNVIIAQAV